MDTAKDAKKEAVRGAEDASDNSKSVAESVQDAVTSGVDQVKTATGVGEPSVSARPVVESSKFRYICLQ